MQQFNRALQNEILKLSADSFPKSIGMAYAESGELPAEYVNIGKCLHDQIFANCVYLKEHGLITMDKIYIGRPDKQFLWGIRATVAGIDLIRDDGGLGAILNVKTIKFHREAIVVLEDLIAISNLADLDKEKAKSLLGELSTEMLKTVVQAAATAGIGIINS